MSGAEKLLSRQSRGTEGEHAQEEATAAGEADPDESGEQPEAPGVVAKLQKQVEELRSQNSELVLKVQVYNTKFNPTWHTHTHTHTNKGTHTRKHTHTI